jgi:hypothetical protein
MLNSRRKSTVGATIVTGLILYSVRVIKKMATINTPTLEQWTSTVRGCVRAVALANHEFTIDTIRPLLPEVEKEPRPLHNVLKDLEKEGMITASDKKVYSKRAKREIVVWDSNITKESAVKEAHSDPNPGELDIPTSKTVNRIPVPSESPARISEQIIAYEGTQDNMGDQMALDDGWDILPSDEEIDEVLARMAEDDDPEMGMDEINALVVEEVIHYLYQEGYVIAQENPSTRFHRSYEPASAEQLDQIVEGFCEAQAEEDEDDEDDDEFDPADWYEPGAEGDWRRFADSYDE